MRWVIRSLIFIIPLITTLDVSGHCTTRLDGIKLKLQGTTRAKYAIKTIYMNGHIEFLSFELDEFGLTEEQVLRRIEKHKIQQTSKSKAYGAVHSVKLTFSPKSPEHSTDTYMVRTCMDIPSHRLRSLVPVKAGRK